MWSERTLFPDNNKNEKRDRDARMSMGCMLFTSDFLTEFKYFI